MKNDLVLERLILESSHPDTLQYLLTEQDEGAEEDPKEQIAALRKPVEKALEGLNGLIKVVATRINNFEASDFKDHMMGLLEWFDAQIDVITKDMDDMESNMGQALQKVGMTDAASQYGGLVEQVDELKTGVHNVTHLSMAAVSTLAQVVLDGMYHENNTYKDKPMRDVMEAEADLDADKTAKEMLKAMQGELVDPKKKKGGFMAMVKNFFKMGGTDIQVGPLGDESASSEEVVEMALAMTPLQIGRAAEALMDMVKAEEAAEAEVSAAEEEVKEELQDVVAADEEKQGEEEVEAEDDLAPEEAAEEAEEELESAAQEAAASEDPPGVAIAKALDSWAPGLSPTSQKSLQSKNRLQGLKDLVDQSLESAASAVQGEVEKAVQQWRGEHEETLIKSKRFAKKNFDSLQELIPGIAGALLKKTNESGARLTKGAIRRSVYKYLNKKFDTDGMLVESKRWQTLAGIEQEQLWKLLMKKD